jgi:uncharacterized Tic20 family protein
MTAYYQHPSLTMHVTPEQRERAEHWLQEAYADGRVSEDEFDQRIGQVLSAVTRRDLNDAFYGLVEVPPVSRALGVHSAYQPMIRPETSAQVGRGAAGLAHFSVFFLWLLGPALMYAASTAGSYARREAAKAFNFQFVSFLAFMGVGILSAVVPGDGGDWIFPVMAIAWFLLTIVGGAKALQGDDWRNPVRSVLRLQVLREK